MDRARVRDLFKKICFVSLLFCLNLTFGANGGELSNSPSETNPVLIKQIRLGTIFNKFIPWHLAFSPDGEFLAIADALSEQVVVWGLKCDCEVNRISLIEIKNGPMGRLKGLKWDTQSGLFWSPSGDYITTGITIADKSQGAVVDKLVLYKPFENNNNIKYIDSPKMKLYAGALNPQGNLYLSFRGHYFSVTDLVDSTQMFSESESSIPNYSYIDLNIQNYAWSHDGVFLLGRVENGGGVDKRRKETRDQSRWGSINFKPGTFVVIKLDLSLHNISDIKSFEDLYSNMYEYKNPIEGDYIDCNSYSYYSTMKLALKSDVGVFFCRGFHFFDTRNLTEIGFINESKMVDVNPGIGFAFGVDGEYVYVLPSRAKKSGQIFNKNGQSVGSFLTKESTSIVVDPTGKYLVVGEQSEVKVFQLNPK